MYVVPSLAPIPPRLRLTADPPLTQPCTLLFVAILLAIMVVIFSLPRDQNVGWAGSRCPDGASCNGGSLTAADGEPASLHDYLFNASAGDKIWRGFLLGCAVGLFVAALFCCWAPCFRFGARGAVVRAWRHPRRAMADAEAGRQSTRPDAANNSDNEVAEARSGQERTGSGRFVDRAALTAVAF